MTSAGARAWKAFGRGVLVLAGSTLLLCARLGAAAPTTASACITALDRAIMVRIAPDGKIYGENEIDPLVWSGSDYFLRGRSRTQLLAALEALNSLSDADLRRCSPVQRALVQNRVWTVFDHVWLHTGEDREYLQTLMRAMVKLALDRNEIETITDPLAAAASSGRWPAQPAAPGGPDVFLPREIATADGPWMTLGRDEGELVAKYHATQFHGRSLFSLRVRFPEGELTPATYFKTVADFPNAWLSEDVRERKLNPTLPELPVGAEFALIRRLAVVDRAGCWRATALTLSVQLRRYRVTNREALDKLRALASPSDSEFFRRLQSFAEFELETGAVAASQPGRLMAIHPADKRFMFFFAHDFDQVDSRGRAVSDFQSGPQNTPMRFCANCHAGLGLGSVNTLIFPSFPSSQVPPLTLARLTPHEIADEADKAASWKTQQAEWSALQALWPVAEKAASVH